MALVRGVKLTASLRKKLAKSAKKVERKYEKAVDALSLVSPITSTEFVYLELPEPPSVNRIWRRSKHGGVYLAPSVAKFYAKAKDAAKVAGADSVPFREHPVKVTMRWYRSAKRGDLDNRTKIVADSLNGVLWVDDKQIVEWHLYRYDAPKNGRVELTVERA
jgi:Holliday junction resolvase RusA-like endonuclease